MYSLLSSLSTRSFFRLHVPYFRRGFLKRTSQCTVCWLSRVHFSCGLPSWLARARMQSAGCQAIKTFPPQSKIIYFTLGSWPRLAVYYWTHFTLVHLHLAPHSPHTHTPLPPRHPLLHSYDTSVTQFMGDHESKYTLFSATNCNFNMSLVSTLSTDAQEPSCPSGWRENKMNISHESTGEIDPPNLLLGHR